MKTRIAWLALAGLALLLAAVGLNATRYDVPPGCEPNGCAAFDRWTHRVVWMSAAGARDFLSSDDRREISRTAQSPR